MRKQSSQSVPLSPYHFQVTLTEKIEKAKNNPGKLQQLKRELEKVKKNLK